MFPEIRSVAVDNAELKYFSFGSGPKPMVIIPGVSIQSVMLSAGAIAEAYKRFAEDFTVYVLDRRQPTPKGTTVSDMAADAAVVLKTAGVKDACVLGVSQGGMIGLTLAADFPELVSRLAVAASSCTITPSYREIFDKAVSLARQGRSRELNLMFAEAIYTPALFEKFKNIFAEASAAITPEDLTRFENISAAPVDVDFTEKLANIKCPAFVAVGSEDKIFGTGHSEFIARQLGCRLKIYEGFGHAVYDESEELKADEYEFFVS